MGLTGPVGSHEHVNASVQLQIEMPERREPLAANAGQRMAPATCNVRRAGG